MTKVDQPSAPEIIRSMNALKMGRIFEKAGFVAQLLRSDDGKPAIRFLKLGVEGMALFFGAADNDQYRIIVLTALLPGVMPNDRINAFNARGVLPKIYVTDTNTVVELPIPLEAGLTAEAITYYVQAFEVLLKNL